MSGTEPKLPPEFTRWMWGKLNALLCEQRNVESLAEDDETWQKIRAIDERLHEEDLRLLDRDPKMRHAFESLMDDGAKDLLHSLTRPHDEAEWD